MPGPTDPLHIKIQKPRTNGSKVTFSFAASRNVESQARNSWYVDYQGLDVSHVSSDIFTLVFLAWQLPVFLKSRAQQIVLSAEFPVSEDVWLFVERLMRNKGISVKRVQFEGLSSRPPAATDGTPGYGYREGKTLCVVPNGVTHGLVREVLTRFMDVEKITFRSLEVIFAAEIEPAVPAKLQSGFSSQLNISSNFGVTLRQSAIDAAPRAFSAYALAAVPGLVAGGFTHYATFLGGNRFWQHAVDSGSVGNGGQRTENFQALSDFLATAIHYPVQFANLGRSLSGLGATRVLNRLAPEWTARHEAAFTAGESWASRPASVLAYVAASVDREGVMSDRARSVLRESSIYASLRAVSQGGARVGWDGNLMWDSRLGIPDFEQMELHELCNLLMQRTDEGDAGCADLLQSLAPFGKRGYPDLWHLEKSRPGEYRNGFEECIHAVLEGVTATSDWRGEYPLRSEAVKFKGKVELPRPWPMSFRSQGAAIG